MQLNIFESKLLEKDSDIQSIQNQVSSLIIENNNLLSELSKIKLLCNSLISKEANYASIQSQLNEKESKIVTLKSEVFELSRLYIDTQYKLKLQYEKDVSQIKYQQENFAVKIETASKIEKLNEIFYNKILELEDMIIHFKEEEKKRINLLELKHNTKENLIKKKMLDYLRNESRNKDQSSIQYELNEKLNTLHRREIINELEFQSCLIETLIKERDELKHKIKELQNDIKIHCEVENCLCEKNKKLEKELRLITQSDAELSSTLSIIKNIKRPKYPSDTLKTITVKGEGGRFIKELKKNSNYQLQRGLIAKDKLIEDYKSKYETAQGQLDLIEKKYTLIGLLCNEALEDIYANKQLKIGEVYLSVNEFEQSNFEKMSKEQRYAALVIIIKYILPFINKEVVKNNALNSKVDYIKTKVYSGSINNRQRKHNDSNYTFSSATITANTEHVPYKRKKHIKHIQITSLTDLNHTSQRPILQAKNKLDLNSFSLFKVDYE